jgi:HTH-type transcriptional regulator / antitoxin HipB
MAAMKITRPKDIGALVKDRRRALSLTQVQLAAKAGVSQRYITQLERGRDTLQLGHVLRVLRILAVDLLVEIPASPSEPTRGKPRKSRPPKISIDSLVDG